MSDELLHYGVKRRSGRYPWGSGKDEKQRGRDFLGYVQQLQEQGLTEAEIAQGMGMTTTQLRTRKSLVKAEKRAADAAQALKLKEAGMSNVAIGKEMGLNESSVRALLDPVLQSRADITVATSKMLREAVEKKGYIDVGAGVETHIGISRTKLNNSLAMLQDEGYKVYYVQTEQLGTGKKTTIKVLAPPDTPYAEVYRNRDQIRMPTDYTQDGGETFHSLKPVRSVDSKRIMVRYAEDGGADKDGVLEIRRGVDDISLGNAKYAQVRVAVDGTHYMKGMAMYADNLPPGVDVIYNSNKPRGSSKDKVFKTMKEDPENPFGTNYRQRTYIGKDGKEHVSAMNIVNEEGAWGEWSKSISSQVLSKQSPSLAKKQLGMAYDLKREEYEEIMALTNPVVRKRLLESFADDCDSSAVHLKAAALPRQASHVILPVPDMKPNEVYAPNYHNGESVVLIRHPHGGTFEIPELTVNNKNSAAISVMRNARDAVGIHPSVAAKLSGADFDGDTVLVIPNRDGSIKTSPSLKGLADFDPKKAYPAYDGMPKMSPRTKQMQMGDVSNLITDMTIKGANAAEIARAVRHSMVVIDAEKHHLNYKQSAIDNGIPELKKKYQGGERSGAATLVSRASSEQRVPHRKDSYKIDPRTGRKVYEETGETFVNAKGKRVPKTTVSTKMAEAQDASSLSSGTRMEAIYADHANSLKALANRARKEYLKTPSLVYSPSARITYSKEVASLKAKLSLAFRNKPLERQAQLLANKQVSMRKAANPGMEAADLKKIKGQELIKARARTGAEKQQITITPREWEAIQLGAVSNNVLAQILLNADLDQIKQLATPRTSKGMSAGRITRAKSMVAAGYTQAEIASALGVSTTTVQEALQ